MTNELAAALATLNAAQDACQPLCTEARDAREAYTRSRSKKNALRLAIANAAFDDALDLISGYHDAVERAEDAAAAQSAAAADAERAAAQPDLFA